jgi:hypothetical protein
VSRTVFAPSQNHSDFVQSKHSEVGDRLEGRRGHRGLPAGTHVTRRPVFCSDGCIGCAMLGDADRMPDMGGADDRLVRGFGADVPDLVGKNVNDATETAAARGIDNVRVLDSIAGVTITPMTMDWSPTRLTLVSEKGIVVRASFG